jgi:hypothetical protein
VDRCTIRARTGGIFRTPSVDPDIIDHACCAFGL